MAIDLDVKSLIAIIMATAGGATYTETTYMKVSAAQEQFREFRIDGLYRDVKECDETKKKRPNEEESILCQRAREQLKVLLEQQQPKKK